MRGQNFWVISASQNIAHVKPAKAGAATNLNLVTTSGTVYSFLLHEGKTPAPDLKVYVTADPQATRSKPKFYPAAQVTLLQAELTEARAAKDGAQRTAEDAITAFKQQYPTTFQFVYGARGS